MSESGDYRRGYKAGKEAGRIQAEARARKEIARIYDDIRSGRLTCGNCDKVEQTVLPRAEVDEIDERLASVGLLPVRAADAYSKGIGAGYGVVSASDAVVNPVKAGRVVGKNVLPQHEGRKSPRGRSPEPIAQPVVEEQVKPDEGHAPEVDAQPEQDEQSGWEPTPEQLVAATQLKMGDTRRTLETARIFERNAAVIIKDRAPDMAPSEHLELVVKAKEVWLSERKGPSYGDDGRGFRWLWTPIYWFAGSAFRVRDDIELVNVGAAGQARVGLVAHLVLLVRAMLQMCGLVALYYQGFSLGIAVGTGDFPTEEVVTLLLSNVAWRLLTGSWRWVLPSVRRAVVQVLPEK